MDESVPNRSDVVFLAEERFENGPIANNGLVGVEDTMDPIICVGS